MRQRFLSSFSLTAAATALVSNNSGFGIPFASAAFSLNQTSTSSSSATAASSYISAASITASGISKNLQSQRLNMSTDASTSNANSNVDPLYPGTAVKRLNAVRARVATLSQNDLNGEWEDVRRKLLWAGGLRDLPDAAPGKGYTGHSFNDYNHVDLTTMNDQNSDNLNDGEVEKIAIGNFLGEGIRIASLPELGPGGSWSTCAIGCNVEPPRDVAHIQFRSRIAFKLVWAPIMNGEDLLFDTFALVDDEGNELARGSPTGRLPSLRERVMNYRIVQGSKYAHVVDEIAATRLNADASKKS